MSKLVVCFDLDDTLYKEIDFLKSGYRKVSELVEKQFHYDAQRVYENLLSWYFQKENPFVLLNESYELNYPIEDYLNLYRFHQPSINLSNGVENTLNELKRRGFKLGLITDGRTTSQKNKIHALNLDCWFEEKDIIISEEFGYEKTNEKNFRYFMDLYPGCKYFYVGDNPSKDFVVPNSLNWVSIMLEDDGRNIHKQRTVSEVERHFYKIKGFNELINTIERVIK